MFPYASSLCPDSVYQVMHKAQVNINKYHFKKASIKQLLLQRKETQNSKFRGFCGLEKDCTM